MNLYKRFETLLGTGQAVLSLGTDFRRPELDPRFALHQRGGDLHYDGFYGVRAGPALFRQQFHTDGATYQHVAAYRRGKKPKIKYAQRLFFV